MPRRTRVAPGGYVYHVLNRRAGGLRLFTKTGDYKAFEGILEEAYDRTRTRILAYCLMPTHWHLLLWPREEGELSEVLRWISVTHTQRWHAHQGTSGSGPVYQGRFKSFPVKSDEHFLAVARYVERNPLRAQLVARAEEWRWSSLWRREQGKPELTRWLHAWPVERPRNWLRYVNRPETPAELEALRICVQRGRPFGNKDWMTRIAKRLGLESSFRPRGRPRGS